MTTKYHVPESCNNCRGENKVTQTSGDGGLMCGAETECKKCGHLDYWAYGFFESSSEMESNCKKYINENGKLRVLEDD